MYEALVEELIESLLCDMPTMKVLEGRFARRRDFLQALMNQRPPLPLTDDFLNKQDQLLQAERDARGCIDLRDAEATRHPQLFLWRGDIRRVALDAIVNAANSALLGCFIPLHNCIDNVIHSAAGLQLRRDCHELMRAQAHEEPTGQAKITRAYNLPARYVLHTVGPVIADRPRPTHRAQLASCYRECLSLAEAHQLTSVAFCCISTGVFHYPQEEAAQVAIETVLDYIQRPSSINVLFNVFTEEDHAIYRRLLQ